MCPATASADTSPASFTNDVINQSTLRQPADGLGPRARRTIASIFDATREVFLTRGYSGTTIDEIARIADVSRASFYTYFPSKREVLIAVGDHSASESQAIIKTLADRPKTRAGMVAFVSDYFGFLEVHGSFAFAWTQAAQEDEGIRIPGMKRHLRVCKMFGTLLAENAGRTIDQPALLGLTATAVLERTWNYGRLYSDTIDRDDLIDETARTLFAMARAQR